MSDNPDSSSNAAELRRRAEERLRRENANSTIEPRGEAETAKLIRDLKIRQIELEIQNEELRASRDQTDEKLKLFRALIDQASDTIEVVDPETGRFLDVNDQGCVAAGYMRDEYLKLSVPEIDTEYDGARFREVVQALRSVKSMLIQTTHRRKNGTTFPVEVHVSLVRQDREYLIATVRDITKRKRTEAALHESEERFRQLAGHVNEVFWIADRALNSIVYVSPAYEKIWGRSCESLYQDPRSWLDAIHSEDRARVIQSVSDGERGHDYDETYRIVRPDGTIRWIFDRGYPVRNERGEVYRVVGTSVDITDRKYAEEAQRISEERFRIVTENARVGLVMIDRDRRYLFVNAAYYEILGLEPANITGQRVADVLAPIYKEQISPRLDQAFAGERVAYELQKSVSGIERFYAVRYEPMASDGVVTKVVVVITDVTELKQAESARSASMARYRTLFECAPDGIILVNNDGVYVDGNPAICRMLGYSRDELLALRPYGILAPEELTRIQEARDVVDRGDDFQREWRFRRKDGTLFDADVVATKMSDGNRVGVIRDITDRKQAQLATEQLAAIVRFSDDAIVGKDLNGIVTAWNKGAERLFGYTADEIVGTPILRLIPAERHGEEEHILNKVRRGESVEHFETQRLTKTGRLIDLSVSASPIKDAAGNVIGASKIARDITAHKIAEARIAQLNRVYAVLSGINHAIVREKNRQALLNTACRIAVDKGGFLMAWIGILDTNEQFLKPAASAGMVGDFLEKVIINLDDPETCTGPAGRCVVFGVHQICTDIASDPRFRPWRADALRLGYRSAGAFPVKVDGKTVGALTLYSDQLHFFDVDELILLDEMAMDIGFALEINQREVERKRIHESHERLATAVDQAMENILITDTGGTIQYVNPAFEKTSGYTLAEAVGKNPRFLKSGKQDAAFYRQMWDTLKRGDDWHGHFTNRRKDGSIYEEDATISPIRDAAGKVVNYVAVKRDVTREVELEAQFRQSQKMEAVGLLAAGVAHDFNNMMSVVMGYSDLWLMKLPADAPIRGPLKAIRNAGERASDLTRQLLAFSRKAVLELKIVDLNEMVRETEKMLKRLIGEDIRFTSILNPGIPRIKVDPGQVGQVLMNLAVNARDAMPQGGELTVQTGAVDFDDAYVQLHLGAQKCRHVLLSVSDTGTGMPPDVLSRIFEPFFTTKGVGKGTGLGLAVVHGVVTQSGGTIQVESEVGAGTTFKLYFPATMEEAHPAATPGEMMAHAGIETILLVEDEESLRDIAAESLRSFGYNVLPARSGAEALEIESRHQGLIDLMLTDVIMPGMSGRELAETLKRKLPDLKVVYMSGYTDDSIVRHGINHEKVNFLQKPFAPFDLIKKIRDVLDKVK